MLIPVIASLFGFAVGKLTKSKPAEPQRQAPAPAPSVGRLRPPEPQISYIEMLEDQLSEGVPIPRKLIRLALEEAINLGDAKTARAISILFSKSQEKKEATESKESPTDMQSPIEHVATDAWKDFVAKLKVRDPGYATDRHVGCFEHNRQRLRALGIPEPKTEDDQYKALVTDLVDHYASSKKLIDEFSGDAVNIDGTEHPITMSGILSLLKSGGTEGAEQWLKDPTVREKFPRAKELFLRANGCF